MIFFSIQDLFNYWKAHATISGIQRVQAGIALHAIATGGDDIGFLLSDFGHHAPGEFLLVSNTLFYDIIVYATGDQVDHDVLRQMILACEKKAMRVVPKKGDAIILLGAFWVGGNTIDRYLPSRRAGVVLGAYIYDLIPLTHPEYCQPYLVRDHSQAVCEMGLAVDFAFTISDYTRHELDAFLARYGGRRIPSFTVPLAHALTTEQKLPDVWPSSLRMLKGRRYVAYVSTIEGRKNHRYVVEAWRQLIMDGVDVPDLVFVGREGWRIGGLKDLLDGTGNLEGRVHLVHDLSDAELNAVYAHASFTTFTSFVEGWGLPVGESLVHGVPCVASGTSSIPEVGGDFVDYIDPLDLRAGVEVFRRMIEDKDYLQSRRDHIRNAFVPRTWDDVGRDFMEQLHKVLTQDFPEHPLHPTWGEGTIFQPGALVTQPIDFREQVRGPMRMAMLESFYHIEPWGAWMRGAAGELNILTGLPKGTRVVVYATLQIADSAAGDMLVVELANQGDAPAGSRRPYKAVPDRRALVRTEGLVGENGLCTVVFTLSDTPRELPGDPRRFGLGLVALGFARADHLDARNDLAERMVFHDMSYRPTATAA